MFAAPPSAAGAPREPFLPLRALDNLYHPPEQRLYPLHEFSCVGPISAQISSRRGKRPANRLRGAALLHRDDPLHIGCVDQHRQGDYSYGIDDYMVLATLNLFSRIITARSPFFGALHTLGVDDRGAGSSLASLLLGSNLLAQGIM